MKDIFPLNFTAKKLVSIARFVSSRLLKTSDVWETVKNIYNNASLNKATPWEMETRVDTELTDDARCLRGLEESAGRLQKSKCPESL